MGGGGGGGGGSGPSRNDMSLGDRPLSGIPWPVNNEGIGVSGFLPGTTPGADPFGVSDLGDPNLADTAAGSYNTAVGGTGAIANLGLGALGANMPGMSLDPYMNPYQSDVIDATMDRIGFQKDQALQGISNDAMAAKAFGGARHGVRESLLDRQYGDIEASTLSDLNRANFQNAQDQQRFFAGLGAQTAGQGFSNLGNLANMGFGMTRQLNQDQMAAGAMQQQMMQRLIDAAKGQYAGYTGFGDRSLLYQSELPPIGNAGTQTTETTQTIPFNPAGMGVSLLGALFGM